MTTLHLCKYKTKYKFLMLMTLLIIKLKQIYKLNNNKTLKPIKIKLTTLIWCGNEVSLKLNCCSRYEYVPDSYGAGFRIWHACVVEAVWWSQSFHHFFVWTMEKFCILISFTFFFFWSHLLSFGINASFIF